MNDLVLYNVVIVGATFVGGLLPLMRRWSERMLHLFVAAATGVFLGTTFVHLLPELAELHPTSGAWSLVALSVVVLFAIERIGLGRSAQSGGHAVLGTATFIGLAFHSVAAGFTLGVGRGLPELQRLIFVAIVAHKGIEAFSLSTVLLLAERSRASIVALVTALACMVPLGTLLGHVTSADLAPGALAVPMAVGTGTFIYVSLCDLLPEVFHDRKDAWPKVLLIVLGVVAALAIDLH